MRVNFRTKLMTIVGTAAVALLILIATGELTDVHVARQLATIQKTYVPKVKLGPLLEGDFERLRRGFLDAVAAQDMDALEDTERIRDALLRRLASADNDVVSPRDSARLRAAIEDYYRAAFRVSRAIILGQTGEDVVATMEAMQAKHARTAKLLAETTAFDEGELVNAFRSVAQAQKRAGQIQLLVTLACLLLVVFLSFWVSRSVFRSLAALTEGFQRFGRGEFDEKIRARSNDELGDVAQRANEMAENLARLNAEREAADWVKTGYAGFVEHLRGELTPTDVATGAAGFLARYCDVPLAALYYVDGPGETLKLLGQSGMSSPESKPDAAQSFRFGEGLVGEAALTRDVRIVTDLPPDFLRIRSGLGEGAPRALVFVPLLHLGEVHGVLELAVFKPWSSLHTELVTSVRETLVIKIEVARAHGRTHQLLVETQEQAKRLAGQEERLRTTNEELQQQQEELQLVNEELKEQTEQLETQRRTLEQRNVELDDARRGLEKQAKELTTVSTYKSRFLANMSHELRTPLNSMLLLSNLLAENETGNLTSKQVEFCRTIHSAGKDLLALINQVLDLAKIEAGKQDIRFAPVSLKLFADYAQRIFGPLARDRGLELRVDVAPDLPDTIVTDRHRVDQILNNLIGNAIKFTEKGSVTLRITRVSHEQRFRRDDLQADNAIALSVSDTGPGISPEHQELVFSPFEQIESTHGRRHGGTGLGLTISRELATLLGGELELRSNEGQGSTFVCYLPVARGATATPQAPAATEKTPTRHPSGMHPVRTRSLLVIEDDPVFATLLSQSIEAHGLECIVARDGKTGLQLAKERNPSGIILDVVLPDIDGWTVMQALSADPATASIPVHFASVVEGSEHGMGLGAVGYLTKPATRRDLVQLVDGLVPRRVDRSFPILVVENDVAAGDSLVQWLASEDLQAQRASSAHEALAMLRAQRFACVIVDPSLPDMDGLAFLRMLQERSGGHRPVVIVYTARALSKPEVQTLERYAEAVVLKQGSSAERLLSEIRLFLRKVTDGSDGRSATDDRGSDPAIDLRGRRILVVDDDMRTVYALSATLRSKGAEVFVADTGKVALQSLSEHPDVDAVLMDIMMPEMDGYEAMRAIRKDSRFRELPIIALTAKAMKGDEERCIEAGATDYLPKPIDADRLFGLLTGRFARELSARTG